MNKLKSIKLKSIKLKSIYMSLAALLLGASATAQVWEVKDRVSSCDPKPYITLKFTSGADTLMLGSGTGSVKATAVNIRTASKMEYSVDGGAPVSVPFFTNLDKNDSTLTYFLHDMCYLPAGAEVSVSVPELSLHTAAGAVRQNAEIRAFTVSKDDVYEVKRNLRSSAIAAAANGKSIVVKSPNVLTVDGELACKQLVVEPRLDDVNGNDSTHYAAGVEVLAGGALIVSDTAYYLCHRYDNHASAYLINRGTYSAGSNVFTKNSDNTLKHAYAKKYMHFRNNDPNDRPDNYYYARMPNVAFPVDSIDACFAFKSVTTAKFSIRYTTAAEPYYLGNKILGLNNDVEKPWSMNFSNGASAITFRAKGNIFDEAYVSRPIIAHSVGLTTGGKVYRVETVVNNDYQAWIDWRNLVDGNEELVSKLRSVHINVINPLDGYDYNFQTGLTTYDGPMGLGYLQPSMEPAFFFQQDNNNEDVNEVTISKDNVISVRQAEERYSVDSLLTDYPYVRFYVDDPDMPKGVGRRSVFVAYFLPDETVDALHSEADPDYSKLGFNSKWEANMSNDFIASNIGGGAIFPFVLGRNELTDAGLTIKMFPMQEGENEQVWTNGDGAVKIFADRKQSRVEFGVLDYAHLDRLCVSCGPLSINNEHSEEDILKSTIELDKSTEYGASSCKDGKLYGRNSRVYLFGLETKLNPKKVTAIEEISKEDFFTVRSVLGGIEVRSKALCDVSIVDLAGRIVSEESFDGDIFVPLRGGLYTVKAKTGESSATRKILVK